MKIHLVSIRLLNNAGIQFPLCYSYAECLPDKSHLTTVGNLARVTCAHCRRIARADNLGYTNGAI